MENIPEQRKPHDERAGDSIEASLAGKIASAEDFNALSEAIEDLGGIQGSAEFFSAETVKQLINEVREGTRTADNITRAGGLRERVVQLMNKEKEYDHNEKAVLPKAGAIIKLTKKAMREDGGSVTTPGSVLEGVLLRDIQIGQNIALATGQTSKVRDIRTDEGKLFADTETSTYEIESLT